MDISNSDLDNYMRASPTRQLFVMILFMGFVYISLPGRKLSRSYFTRVIFSGYHFYDFGANFSGSD